jgi:hypothetical protein
VSSYTSTNPDAEVRRLHARMHELLVAGAARGWYKTGQLALVQDASTGCYRFIVPRTPEPPGLLAYVTASTTIDELRRIVLGSNGAGAQRGKHG